MKLIKNKGTITDYQLVGEENGETKFAKVLQVLVFQQLVPPPPLPVDNEAVRTSIAISGQYIGAKRRNGLCNKHDSNTIKTIILIIKSTLIKPFFRTL